MVQKIDLKTKEMGYIELDSRSAHIEVVKQWEKIVRSKTTFTNSERQMLSDLLNRIRVRVLDNLQSLLISLRLF